MKLLVMCLLSAFLTITAECSVLSAQSSGSCPSGGVRHGSVCVDVATGTVAKLLRLR
ncbi:MAG: hypothetical protein JWM40_2276 [Frankiales bacterium]|nr:hypothetical protein [Frankiales bacterium]